MAWRRLDPRIPWIFVALHPDGGGWVGDARTGEQEWCPDEGCVYGFAADRSGGRWAIGNIVHRALSALGFRRCGGCAQRQISLNLWTPWA